jgi:4-aminobutyrate aminotransferase-like enzyme
VIRLLPPLVIRDAEARELVATLAALVRQFLGKGA